MGKQTAPQQLAKFLAYVLGRHPDEFGLVPDPQGFVPIKEVLKVCAEEKDWRHVRARGLIEALGPVLPDAPIEMDTDRYPGRRPQPPPPAGSPLLIPLRCSMSPSGGGPMAPFWKGDSRRPPAAAWFWQTSGNWPFAWAGERTKNRSCSPCTRAGTPGGLPISNGSATIFTFARTCRPSASPAHPFPGPWQIPRVKKKEPVAAVPPKTPGSFILDPTQSSVPPSVGKRSKKAGRKPKRQPPPWRS